MTLKRCNGCNAYIDTGACNQKYGILTTVTDTDKDGTKKKRRYLCKSCLISVNIRLHDRQQYIVKMGLLDQNEKRA